MNKLLRSTSRLWLLFAAFLLAQSAWAQVVISQVYGGGGGASGTYLYDYVELFNQGTSSINLSGSSLQYGSGTGQFGASASNIVSLTGTIGAGKYYLVQLGAAGTGGAALPVTPDQVTGNLSMGAASGKVALASITTALGCGATATPCSLPSGNITDLVSYGASNNAEGGATANNGVALVNTQGAVRKNSGCQDTNNNNADFTIVSGPIPRNSSAPANVCGAVTPILSASPTSLTGLSATQGSVSNSKSFTVSGSNLDATPVSVSATANVELSTDNSTFTPTLSLPTTASAVSQVVYARLTSAAPTGAFSGTITSTANTTLSASVTVSGQVNAPNAPALSASPTTLSSFSTPQGTVSAEQTYTLTAANLTAPITVSTPAGVEVSQTTGSGFGSTLTLPMSTTSAVVYVHVVSPAVLSINGTITNVAGSLTANVAVTGTVSSTSPYTSIAIARAGINSTFTVAGRVTVSNQLGARQIYIQDPTGGIAIYSGASGPDFTSLVNIGDSVQVRGPVTVFNGYLELTGTGNFTVVSGAGTRVPTPVAITPDQLANYQGQLVSIANATITPVAATFAGGSSYTITAGGQSNTLRISANSPLAGAGQPANPVSVTGISDRFSSGASTTGTTGMQLQPRILDDIPGSTPATDLTCTIGSSTTLTRDQTLDIAAWNFEFFGADAGSIICPVQSTTLNYANFGPVNEQLQQTNATAVLTKLNADIISAEEISDINRFDAAVKAMPGSYSYVCSNRFSYYFQDECTQTPSGNPPVVFGPTRLAQKVCVIYNTATVTPVLGETKALLDGKYDYPSSSGWSSGRLPFLFVANVTINGVTQKIHVVALHAKSGSATADYNRRKQDVIDLKTELDANYANAKIIILGDYNDKLNGSIATGQQSSYQPFVTDAANYSAITLPLENQNCSTFNSSASFIDHMITSSELAKAYVSNSVYVLQPFSIPNYGNTTSDHNPIVSRYDLTQLVTPATALTLVASATPTTILTTGTTTLSATVSGGTTPYSYTFSGPGTIAQSGNTASVSGLTAGVQTFTITASDATTPASQTISATVSVTVNAANVAPVATANANQTATVGTAFSYTVNAFTDETPASLVYTASGLPTGLNFDATSRIISGTPSLSGVSTVTVTATDSGSLSASTSFTITVNPVPVVITSLTLVASANPSTILTTGTTALSATVSGGTTPYSYTFSGPGTINPSGNTATVSGLTAGVQTFTITASDATAPTSQTIATTVSVTVNAANQAPVATANANQTATVGTAFSYTVNAFTDETPASLVYTASGLPDGLSFNAGNRVISGTPSVTGVSTVSITATDPGSLSASTTFTITVSASAVIPTGPATLTITSFNCFSTNGALSSVNFVVGYSNGTFTPALPDLFINGVTITGKLGQPYTFNFDGNQSFLPIQDQATRSTYFVWDFRSACAGPVTPPSPTAPVAPSLPNQTATQGTPFSYVVPAFTGTAPIAYAANGLPAGLSFDASSRTISGTPSLTGVSTVVVSASNAAGQSSGQFTITVSGSATQPTGPATLTITSFNCFSTNGALSSVNFVVGYSNGTFTPALPNLFINGVTITGQLGQTYSFPLDANTGPLPIQDNATRSTYFVWDFRQACAGPVTPPSPTAPVAPALPNQTATQGTPFSYVVPAFTGTAPIAYAASGLPAGLSFDASSRTISGTPSLTGVSTVVISASNAAGQSSGQFTITVSGSATQPTGPATLTITSFNCFSTNGALSSVNFVVGYSNGTFSPALPNLFINGVTITGQLGQTYSFPLDANTGPLPIQDNATRSTYFVWDYRSACATQPVPTRLATEGAAPLQLTVLGNPVNELLEVAITGAAGGALQVSLTDAQGRTVGQHSLEQAGTSEVVRFTLSQQATGVLLLRATTPTQQQTIRVLKAK